MTDSKPGSRVDFVDTNGRPIGSGAGSSTGTGGYGSNPFVAGNSGGGFPIGTKPGSYSQQNGATGPGGSSPGNYGNGHGSTGPGSSYTNGRQNGKKQIIWRKLRKILGYRNVFNIVRPMAQN